MPTILKGTTKLGYKDYIRTIMLKEAGGGFTLMELMIVIAILGTIAGIAIPQYASYIEKARVTRAIVEIHMVEKEISMYTDDNHALPDTLDDIGRGDLKDPWGNLYKYLSFATLDKGPGKGGKGDKKDKKDKGGTVDTGPSEKPRKDRFLVPINSDYDLYSMGRDGKTKTPLTAKDSHDDVIRCNDGEFVGLAYKF
jgi:general secretion pathway protein G